MRALAVLLAAVLIATGINLPFSVGTLQAAVKENGTDEVQELALDEQAKGGGQEEEPVEPATPPSLEDSGILGKGTEAEPYQIGSKDHLEAFRDYVNAGDETNGKYFSLTDTIKATFNSSGDWTPIGTQDHPFEGTFQGVADRSRYLYLQTNTVGTGDVALFGVIGNNGTVRDLLLGNGGSSDRSASIGCPKAARAAGIAITNNGTISNCMVNCGVQAKGGRPELSLKITAALRTVSLVNRTRTKGWAPAAKLKAVMRRVT